MNSLEYIDNYFKGPMATEASRTFEQRIESDPVFAEEVAFYLAAQGIFKQQADAEKKQRFSRLQSQPAVVRKMPFVKTWYLSAAASVLLIVISAVYFLKQEPGMQHLADAYIQKNLMGQNVTMSNGDSVQMGLRYYNEKNYGQALLVFEILLQSDPFSGDQLKYAGLAALQAGRYDKAILYFGQLQALSLRVNPGKILHALTLMKRNQEGDEAAARDLLQQVVQENGYGRENAQQWLRSLNGK